MVVTLSQRVEKENKSSGHAPQITEKVANGQWYLAGPVKCRSRGYSANSNNEVEEDEEQESIWKNTKNQEKLEHVGKGVVVVVVVKGERRKFRAVSLIQQDMTINKLSILVIVPREITPGYLPTERNRRFLLCKFSTGAENSLMFYDEKHH